MSTQPLRPLYPRERLDVLDALRGFALCGILVGNMQWFAGYGLQSALLARQNAAADELARLLMYFFIEGKFYSIFSFLFGFGFALQIGRAERGGDVRASLFKWRLFWLLLVGLLHACLLWAGEILSVYAATGFILLLFRRKSDRSLLRWTLALLSFPVLSYALVYAFTVGFAQAPPKAPDLAASTARWDQQVRLFSGGSYLEILKVNLGLLKERILVLLYEMRVPKVLGMFLLGVYAFRRGYFNEPATHEPFIRRVVWWGLVLGLPANAALAALLWMGVFAPPSGLGVLESAVYAVGVPSLALFYVAGFLQLWRKTVWRRRLTVLAPAGRMALTNYLMQTVVCVLIFRGYGLGLFGRLGAAAATVLALFIFILQVWLSTLWLKAFNYGPTEWVWRQLTYRRRLPLRARQHA